MLDTNTISQVNTTALAATEVVQQWWPVLIPTAALVAREVRNFNVWALGVSEYLISHGGALLILKKLFWNPPAAPKSTELKS